MSPASPSSLRVVRSACAREACRRPEAGTADAPAGRAPRPDRPPRPLRRGRPVPRPRPGAVLRARARRQRAPLPDPFRPPLGAGGAGGAPGLHPLRRARLVRGPALRRPAHGFASSVMRALVVLLARSTVALPATRPAATVPESPTDRRVTEAEVSVAQAVTVPLAL